MPTTQYAAEFCLPGHPDKLCDAVADALVEEAARRERRALCGVEVAVHRSTVFVTAASPVATRPRSTWHGSPGTSSPAPATAAAGVPTRRSCGSRRTSASARSRRGRRSSAATSDDQSIVTGYAVDLPGTNYLPPEHWLAYRLARPWSG